MKFFANNIEIPTSHLLSYRLLIPDAVTAMAEALSDIHAR